MRTHHRWNLCLTLCLLLGVCLAATARAQTARTSIIIDRQAVRFVTQGEAVELRLMISDQQGEVVFDSGFVHDTALEWPLRNQRGEAVASGLYSYALSAKSDTEEKARTQRGHVILDRPSSNERIWVTSDKSASIGAESPDVRLTVVGSGEVTVGGAELEATARHRDRTGEGQVGEGRRTPPTRAVGEEKRQDTSAVSATPNRLAKYASDGATLVDSSVTESPTGDIGIGTSSPGGVFDLQRSSAGDILQRLWNTGAGGAKLRYVAATGATSQLQLTDGLEWLMAIAGNNSTGMQFRVRDTGDANNEATLATKARMTILRNGNVGIGTTTPTAALDVVGSLQVQDTGANTGRIHVGANSATAGNPKLIVFGDGDFVHVGEDGTDDTLELKGKVINFRANGTVQMAIDADGHVGVGTSIPNPFVRLQVQGGSLDYAVVAVSHSSSHGTDSGAAIYGSNDAGGWAGHFNGDVRVAGNLYLTGTINPPSDRHLKANFSTVNPRFILNRLATIPIQTWNYKSENNSVRHLGPMAQDFRAAFNLGIDDKHISTVDADGVALAAIQGLYRLSLEKDRQIRQLTRRLAEEDQKNASLARRVAALEQALQQLLGQQNQAQAGKAQPRQ